MVLPDEQDTPHNTVQSILIFAVEPHDQKLVKDTLCCHDDWSVRFVTTEKQALQEILKEMPALFLVDMRGDPRQTWHRSGGYPSP